MRGSICKSKCSQLTERKDYIVKAKCIKERRFGENTRKKEVPDEWMLRA
jgi:hypothetical protein